VRARVLVAASELENVASWAQIIGTVGIFLAVWGLFIAHRDLDLAQKATRIQFLMAIDDAFLRHRGLRLAIRTGEDGIAFKPPSVLKTGQPPTAEHLEFFRYMTVFERIAYALRDRLVDIETVGPLYGPSLGYLLNNSEAAKHVEARPERWQAFVYLWDHLQRAEDERGPFGPEEGKLPSTEDIPAAAKPDWPDPCERIASKRAWPWRQCAQSTLLRPPKQGA
jgi:hypothetical protein